MADDLLVQLSVWRTLWKDVEKIISEVGFKLYIVKNWKRPVWGNSQAIK